MTDQEKVNAETTLKFALQDARFSLFVHEMRDFKNEMRDRDNQRAEDIRAMNSKFDSLSNQIHNLTIAAVVGFGAIAIAVGGLVVAALK